MKKFLLSILLTTFVQSAHASLIQVQNLRHIDENSEAIELIDSNNCRYTGYILDDETKNALFSQFNHTNKKMKIQKRKCQDIIENLNAEIRLGDIKMFPIRSGTKFSLNL